MLFISPFAHGVFLDPNVRYATIASDPVDINNQSKKCLTCNQKLTASQLRLPHEWHDAGLYSNKKERKQKTLISLESVKAVLHGWTPAGYHG